MQKQNPVQETDLRREGYGKGPAFPPGPIGHFLGFSAIRASELLLSQKPRMSSSVTFHLPAIL